MDALVNEAFAAAGYPLLHIPVGTHGYDTKQLSMLITQAIQTQSQPITHNVVVQGYPPPAVTLMYPMKRKWTPWTILVFVLSYTRLTMIPILRLRLLHLILWPYSGEHFDGRRFASSIRPAKGQYFACFERKADMLDGLSFSVAWSHEGAHTSCQASSTLPAPKRFG
jgi:hypothetical protein